MAQENYINFTCPHCGAALEYLEQYAGMAQPCPHCAEDVIVPEPGQQEGRGLPLPLQTPRLLLRRLELEDAEDLLELLSDPEIFRYEPRPAWEAADVQSWLPRAVKAKLSDDEGRMAIALVHEKDRKLIGLLQIAYPGITREQVGLDIQINRNYQRQGLATEALLAGLNFCFRDIGLHRVTVTTDSRDAAAVGLLTKVGMRKEGECLKDRFINGEWANSVWFAMLQEEFLAKLAQA